MAKNLKKLLALILALSMVISMLCVTAFAEEDEPTSGDEATVLEEGDSQEEGGEDVATPSGEEEPAPGPDEPSDPEEGEQGDSKEVASDEDDEEVVLSEAENNVSSTPPVTPEPPAPQDAQPEQPEQPTVSAPDVSGAKFAVVVSSKLDDGSITYVYGIVGADYQAKLVLPGAATGDDLAKVNAGNATIKVSMNDVASLGGGNKSYEKTIETGVENVEVPIANNASQLYEFGGTTITANIINGKTTASVTYKLSKAETGEGGNTVINGTATEADARAAWQMMTSYIEAGSKVENNSFIEIAPNSWLQIGENVLVFEENHKTEALTLDNITAGNMGKLNDEIRQAVKLEKAEKSGLSFCLGKGTKLALSNSAADLNKDVVVTVSGADLTQLGDVLSDLQSGVGGDGKDVILTLLGLMNKALAAVEDQTLTVDIDFTEQADEPVKPEEPTEPDVSGAKFAVVVSSKLSDKSTTYVVGTVDANYQAELVLPNKEVNAGNVTIKVSMNDVGSLGGGNKSHSMTLSTGVEKEVELFTALNGLSATALRDFDGATINATIKSGGDEKSVTYTLKGEWTDADGKTITGTPNTTAAARAAWALMVNSDNFTVGTQAADSKIVIANGSSLQIGTEVLEFEDSYEGNLVLDNITNMKVEDITKAVKLTNAETPALTFTLKKGTTLAVSSSYAKLEKDVVVTVGGVETAGLTVLSEIQKAVNSENLDAVAAIKSLIDLMDAAIKLVDNAEGEIGVTIEFVCDHNWGEWTVTTPAAVGTAGVETRTCSACGEKETQTIPALTRPTIRPTTPVEDIEDEDPPLSELPISVIFADVADDVWYASAVRFAYENELMLGVDDGSKFAPATESTRGMIALILYRVEGEPSVADLEAGFPDVAENAWYHDAAVWALSAGVFAGYDDGGFHGEDKITREQLATVLYRYAEMKGWNLTGDEAVNDLADFIDNGDVADWAEAAMNWAASTGLMNGRAANVMAPQGEAQRCELATVLMRLDAKYNMLGNETIV